MEAIGEQSELYALTLLIAFVNIATALSSAIFAFYAIDVLHVSARELGLIYSFTPVGGLLATLFISKSLEMAGRGKLILGSSALDIIALI